MYMVKFIMNAKEILKILKQNGFTQISQRGSHIKLAKNDKFTIVANHGKKDIPLGTVKQIEKSTGVKLR